MKFTKIRASDFDLEQTPAADAMGEVGLGMVFWRLGATDGVGRQKSRTKQNF